MSEITTDEQAMQWCRERGISVNTVEVPGKVRLYFQDDLLMEGDTLREAVAKVMQYSRAPLPKVEQE